MHQLEYISFWILPSKDLDAVGNVSDTLLKAGGVARMYPEDPCLGRPFSDAVRIFDGELRFASAVSLQPACAETNIPNTTKANECSPRSGPCALLVDLIKNGSLIDGGLSVDEVCVATERDDDGRTRWCFYAF